MFHNGLARLFTSTYYASKQSPPRGEHTFIECSFFQIFKFHHNKYFAHDSTLEARYVHSVTCVDTDRGEKISVTSTCAVLDGMICEREPEESQVNTRDKVAKLKER